MYAAYRLNEILECKSNNFSQEFFVHYCLKKLNRYLTVRRILTGEVAYISKVTLFSYVLITGLSFLEQALKFMSVSYALSAHNLLVQLGYGISLNVLDKSIDGVVQNPFQITLKRKFRDVLNQDL